MTSFRRAALTLAAACLVAVEAAPVSAQSTGNFTYVATMSLSAGLDYPCVGPPEGGKTCPPSVTIPVPPSKKTPSFTVNGNTRTGTMSSTFCLGGVQNVNKGPKAPSEGPLCSFSMSFTLTGYCGLASASGTGSFTTTSGQHYFLNYTFTILGTKLALRGNYWKGSPSKPPVPEGDFVLNGDINAELMTVPTNSCLTKTARLFLVAGSGHLVHPKTLP